MASSPWPITDTALILPNPHVKTRTNYTSVVVSEIGLVLWPLVRRCHVSDSMQYRVHHTVMTHCPENNAWQLSAFGASLTPSAFRAHQRRPNIPGPASICPEPKPSSICPVTLVMEGP